MLKRIDRLQVAVPDRGVAAESWTRILGAEPAGEDRIACLGAQRTRLRLADGFIELLEPDGAGSVSPLCHRHVHKLTAQRVVPAAFLSAGGVTRAQT